MKKTILFNIFLFIFSSVIFADDALLKLAESGNPEAQFKVAAMYASGKIGKKSEEDKKKMFYWLEKAANQNYLKAQEILCTQYYNREEFEKSWKWTNVALKKGSNVAKSIMAVFLFDGCGGLVPIDKPKAISLAKECPNEIESKSILCNLYTFGWFDVEPDSEKAMDIIQELEKRNYYMADLHKRDIKVVFNLKNSDSISDIGYDNCFERAIKKNKYSNFIKYAYITILIEYASLYPDLKEKIENIIDELISVNSTWGYYCKYLYEKRINRNERNSEKYLFMAADSYCPVSYFDAYITYLSKNGDDNLKKARLIAEKALKCQDPDCLSEFIVFFNTIENNRELKEVVGEAYIEGFNSLKNIKIAADNGNPKMMYLYSKLTTDKSESEKYLIGACNKRYDFACGDYALNILKTNPEKAYRIVKSSLNKYSCKSPELLYVDGICALEGKVCEKNTLYGLEQLSKSIDLGIKNKEQIIKTIYNSYSDIDEKEFLKENESFNNEDLLARKQINIYFWGKRFMDFASAKEKEQFEAVVHNLNQDVIRSGETRLNRLQSRNKDYFKSPLTRSEIINFGKVFDDVSIEDINKYVNNDLYNNLYKLYGKKNVLNDENTIPDECYDNLKKLTMAVEMYNMDHRDCMVNLDIRLLRNRDMYLSSDLVISDPECSYSIVYSGLYFTINCSKHGTLK